MKKFCKSFNINTQQKGWICICDCGLNIVWDLNASINLEYYGLDKLRNTVSSMGIKTCGESVRPKQNLVFVEAVSMKQEENMSLAKIL